MTPACLDLFYNKVIWASPCIGKVCPPLQTSPQRPPVRLKSDVFIEHPCLARTKLYITASGHMTKMAAMPIHSKNRTMSDDLETWHIAKETRGLQNINKTLDLFYIKVNFVYFSFYIGKSWKKNQSSKRCFWTLQQIDKVWRHFCWHHFPTPQVVCPCLLAIVHRHFQTSFFLLKIHWAYWNQISCGTSLARENRSLKSWSWSHNQDDRI